MPTPSMQINPRLEDERAAFESSVGAGRVLARAPSGDYVSTYVQNDWDVWQARAALNGADAGVSEGWQDIASAPEGVLLVVGWLDPEDDEHPERHDFDYLEDGVWQKHSENVEYFQMCAPPGSRGPSEQAPYTHFMRIAPLPSAPTQGETA